MADVEGVRTFQADAEAYDAFMGRYSRQLAPLFADFCGLKTGQRVLDVGCGPGAFTSVAVVRLGLEAVSAVDPVPHFVEENRSRHPGLDVRQAPAEQIPYGDGEFDIAASQLVFHFLSDAEQSVREMSRVVRVGGTVAACVWDFAEEMEMLRAFWDAALSLWTDAPDEGHVMRFGHERELADLMRGGGLADVVETTLTVTSLYESFAELWSTFLGGIGPAGAYVLTRSPDDRNALREAFHHRLGSPTGPFILGAVARAVRAVTPA
jgi:ubiquinone/menaquinone biosynthesis C-methylase UbiE